MLDLDGILHTMIDGACRRDLTMPKPDIPFDLEIRGMICYKRWTWTNPLTNGNDDPYAEVVEEVEEEAGEEGEEE